MKVPDNQTYIFTSESITEGHPDKVCDAVSDAILDACLDADRNSRVAVECLAKADTLVVAGEVTTTAVPDVENIARRTIREIGYTDARDAFNADGVRVLSFLGRQAPEIAQGVDRAAREEQGAGDQGIMFGYATDETPEQMPLPILLAHRLSAGLAEDRKAGTVDFLRPDGKTQVSVRYEAGRPVEVTDVLVSTQHDEATSQAAIREYVAEILLPRVLGKWYAPSVRVLVNPTGSFAHGGPSVDCGLTGRKIIADTYGGFGRHGGGAFSGKDPSKVDRSGAYFCRFVARQLVNEGLAHRAEVQVAYAIGMAQPISVKVDTFETGDPVAAEAYLRDQFDFRPAAITERLDLLRPIYSQTTNYGHFGRKGLPWES